MYARFVPARRGKLANILMWQFGRRVPHGCPERRRAGLRFVLSLTSSPLPFYAPMFALFCARKAGKMLVDLAVWQVSAFGMPVFCRFRDSFRPALRGRHTVPTHPCISAFRPLFSARKAGEMLAIFWIGPFRQMLRQSCTSVAHNGRTSIAPRLNQSRGAVLVQLWCSFGALPPLPAVLAQP